MADQGSTSTQDQGQEPTAQQRADALATRLAGNGDQTGQASTTQDQQGREPTNGTDSNGQQQNGDQGQDSWLASLPQPARDEIRRLRSEAASHRTGRRTAEQERDELRRAQMTEQQRIEAERDDWKRKAEEHEREAIRARVITAKGLPAEAAAFLTGSTQEELEQNADKLKTMIGPNGSGGRVPDFDAGARSQAGSTDDMNSFIRRSAGRPA